MLFLAIAGFRLVSDLMREVSEQAFDACNLGDHQWTACRVQTTVGASKLLADQCACLVVCTVGQQTSALKQLDESSTHPSRCKPDWR